MKSSFELETVLHWWLLWVHRTLTAFSDLCGSLKSPDPDSAFVMVVLIGLPVGLVLETILQKNRSGNRRLLASYRTNLTIFVCNNLLLSLLSLTTLYTIAERFSPAIAIPGFTVSSAEWLIALIAIDFFLYLWHFANHHIPLLWMFHKVHHSDASMNITTALRFHAGELTLTTAFKALLIVLLGIPVEVVFATEAIIACFTLFHHLNLDFGLERYLKWIFIVPGLHRVHHSAKRAEHDNNFGSVFSVWDRVFGTLREIVPDSVGLCGIPEQNPWQTFVYGFSWRAHGAGAPVSIPNPESVILDTHAVAIQARHLMESQKYPELSRAGLGTEKSDRPLQSEPSASRALNPIWDRHYDAGPDWKSLFEFGLANAMLWNEITQCSWRMNFAYVVACARVSTRGST